MIDSLVGGWVNQNLFLLHCSLVIKNDSPVAKVTKKFSLHFWLLKYSWLITAGTVDCIQVLCH